MDKVEKQLRHALEAVIVERANLASEIERIVSYEESLREMLGNIPVIEDLTMAEDSDFVDERLVDEWLDDAFKEDTEGSVPDNTKEVNISKGRVVTVERATDADTYEKFVLSLYRQAWGWEFSIEDFWTILNKLGKTMGRTKSGMRSYLYKAIKDGTLTKRSDRKVTYFSLAKGSG